MYDKNQIVLYGKQTHLKVLKEITLLLKERLDRIDDIRDKKWIEYLLIKNQDDKQQVYNYFRTNKEDYSWGNIRQKFFFLRDKLFLCNCIRKDFEEYMRMVRKTKKYRRINNA